MLANQPAAGIGLPLGPETTIARARETHWATPTPEAAHIRTTPLVTFPTLSNDGPRGYGGERTATPHRRLTWPSARRGPQESGNPPPASSSDTDRCAPPASPSTVRPLVPPTCREYEPPSSSPTSSA